MNCYIVTGASRGLGLGIARAIVAAKGQLIAIARNESTELQELGALSPGYRFIELDLADSPRVSDVAEEVFCSVAAMDWHGIYLFNNAGVVEPVAPVGRYDDEALIRNLAVNLTAAAQLSNAFVRHLQHRHSDRRIMNVSSGAARKPYTSWSAYCTSKAGLDMFSRCLGAEQAELPNGIRVASIAPGVVDTAMQATLRSKTQDDFAMIERFRSLKENGELTNPDSVGAELLRIMHSDHVRFGDLLDIRDLP